MRIDPKYINCEEGNTACIESPHTATVALSGTHSSLVLGNANGGFDPDFDTNRAASKYSTDQFLLPGAPNPAGFSTGTMRGFCENLFL